MSDVTATTKQPRDSQTAVAGLYVCLMPKSFETDLATAEQRVALTGVEATRQARDAAIEEEMVARQRLHAATLARKKADDALMDAVLGAWNHGVEAMYLAKLSGLGRATLYRHMPDR